MIRMTIVLQEIEADDEGGTRLVGAPSVKNHVIGAVVTPEMASDKSLEAEIAYCAKRKTVEVFRDFAERQKQPA